MAEAKSVDTRERILDAAERLFMSHGYEGTSMRQITSEVSKPCSRIITLAQRVIDAGGFSASSGLAPKSACAYLIRWR